MRPKSILTYDLSYIVDLNPILKFSHPMRVDLVLKMNQNCLNLRSFSDSSLMMQN